jgi:4-hydroxy-tetrahydrodipicolinate synthase
MALEFTKSEAKQWAKKNLKGLSTVVLPSFTPDLAELDEEGIRWDVRFIIENGFKDICIAVEAAGMTFEERKKFVGIVNAEAKGKVPTSMVSFLNTVEEDIELLKHHEKTGGTFACIDAPVQFYPKSADEIYRWYKHMCDSTNLAVYFGCARLHVRKFHPLCFPLEILPKIANIPNVVGMKTPGGSSPAAYAQYFHTVGDQILVNCAQEEFWPIIVPKYGQQWAGAGDYSLYQTPDNPRFVKMFDFFVKGEIDKAMDIYWKVVVPLWERVDTMGQPMAAYFASGWSNMQVMKYWSWCNGGNGGTLRQPTGRLWDYKKEQMKAGLRSIGLTPREPEEEFFVGRVNYAKGARLKVY